ncbi:MAG: sigma 54-interacting transcriptional regulator [Myxococcales bacterium]|nr:sigma 54-interacting transcriptional regulator [Myxococcales bacterium]
MPDLIDLTRDLDALTRLAAQPDALAELLQRALRAIRDLVPYDLAAVYTLEPEARLRVRAADGPLADGRVRRHVLELARFPTIQRALELRRPIALDEEQHTGDEGDPYDGLLDLPAGHSCMVVPLFAGDRSLGMMTFDRSTCGIYPDQSVALAGVYGQVVSIALLFAEQTALLDRLRHQAEARSRLLEGERGTDDAVRSLEASRAPAMAEVVRLAKLVARTDTPVLIQGETGTGKEVLAQAVHAWSPRAERPFIKLNCAAIPAELVESELFGHVKGAFSGATRDREGRFRAANGGTLLLDEVGDMPLEAQAKLLRALQSGTFEPVGSDRSVRVDVRVVAASHVELLKAVQQGRFREDLYYRLAVFPLSLPALRDRPEDAVDLAKVFLDALAKGGRGPWSLSAGALDALAGHRWPGNVRELRNAVERATIVRAAGRISAADLGLAPAPARPAPRPTGAPEADGPFPTFAENEVRHLQAALTRTGDQIYGDGGAAALLGLKPTTLQSKLKKHGLR